MKKKYIILISGIALTLVTTFVILLVCGIFTPTYTVKFEAKTFEANTEKKVLTFKPYTIEKLGDIKVKKGEVIGHQEKPYKSGYVFKGWETADGKEWSLYEDKVYCDMVLYPIWEEAE